MMYSLSLDTSRLRLHAAIGGPHHGRTPLTLHDPPEPPSPTTRTHSRYPPALVHDDGVVLGALVRIDEPVEDRGQLVVNALMADRGQCIVFITLDARVHAHVLQARHHPGTLVRCLGQLVDEGPVLRIHDPRDLELFIPLVSAGASA